VKWIKRISLIFTVIILFTGLALWIYYYTWQRNVIKDLPADTTVISTSTGPIEYVLEGTSDKVMLIVHGTPASVHVSRAEGSFFLDKGFSVLSVSRPGYYQTPLASGITIQEQAALYVSLLNELGIESVYINGVSGGGPSSIQFAIDYPERCAGLILRAAVTENNEPPKEEKSLINKFFETEFGTWLGFQLAFSRLEERSKNNLNYYAKTGYLPFKKTEQGLKNDNIQFLTFDAFEFEKIQSPTIIFHGNLDESVPFSHGLNASQRIPNATLVEMKDKGHFVFFTAYADSINHAIIHFINEIHE
jgi:2-hydroxy-6-oxonona-2,4-dienedioate hydrolase